MIDLIMGDHSTLRCDGPGDGLLFAHLPDIILIR
jgi:hypothetical protein